MNIYTIYKSTNKINGKVYIGFDSNWPHRKNSHKCYYKKGDTKFYRALKKHGWQNFEWTILYQSIDKNHTKDTMENHFIIEHDSFKNGYNSTFGGDGTFGFSNPNRRKGFNSNGWLGKKHTQETKVLMSKNMRGVKKPNANQKGSNNNFARRIQTPFGIFGSIMEASENIDNYSYKMIWDRLQKSSDWFYL
jgi:group I intron endonuclease